MQVHVFNSHGMAGAVCFATLRHGQLLGMLGIHVFRSPCTQKSINFIVDSLRRMSKLKRFRCGPNSFFGWGACGSLMSDVLGGRYKFPLFISQDGTHEQVHSLATSFAPEVSYLNHVEDAPPQKVKKCARA